MSYYKDLVSKGDGERNYLLTVTKFGDGILYKLDEKGDRVGVVVGDPCELLLSAVREVYPHAELNLYKFPHPSIIDPDASRWRDVLATLQGKATTRRRIARELGWVARTLCKNFLGNDPWHLNNLGLTALAITWDKDADEAELRNET